VYDPTVTFFSEQEDSMADSYGDGLKLRWPLISVLSFLMRDLSYRNSFELSSIFLARLALASVNVVTTPRSAAIDVVRFVNTSGKAGAQILHLPLGDDSPPWGR
jgi:protein-tyrosine phosphatase